MCIELNSRMKEYIDPFTGEPAKEGKLKERNDGDTKK